MSRVMATWPMPESPVTQPDASIRRGSGEITGVV